MNVKASEEIDNRERAGNAGIEWLIIKSLKGDLCVFVYMGSGATLVDGVRRWFQRRSSSSFIANNNNNYSSNEPNNNYNSENRVNDRNDGLVKESEDLTIVEEDFDFSGLKLIKVPIRIHLKTTSMQTHKKVFFSFFFFSFFFYF